MQSKTVSVGEVRAIVAMSNGVPVYVVEAWIRETGEPLLFSEMPAALYHALLAGAG